MATNFIRLACAIFFLQFLNNVGNAQKYGYETPKMAGKYTRKQMQVAGPRIENAINIILNNMHAFRESNTSNNMSECMKAIKNSTHNAFSYLDAAGKLPAGFSRGHYIWLGSFDTCQDIPKAHYCLISFTIVIHLPLSNSSKVINETIPLELALCVPSVCGPVDFHEWLEKISAELHKLGKLALASVQYGKSFCAKKPSYTTDVVVTIVFCGILLLLCLLGTLVDVFEWNSVLKSSNEPSSINNDQTSLRDEEVPFQASLQPYNNTTDMNAPLVSKQASLPRVSNKISSGTFVEFLRCFSLVRNSTKIFSTNVPPKVITSINGLRVISMFWIILGHTFLFLLSSGMLSNILDMIDDENNLSLMVILNGYFSVDTFFFLSGLLLAYTCFRKLEKSEGKFNWFLFYFHRYVRLTPSLMFVILFYVKLRPFLAFSPLWTSQKDDHCSKYWWTNLIYINNFYPTNFLDGCINWTWYLANDMQFYIISPFVLILAYRYGRIGLLASAGSLFMVSTICLASIYGYYNLDPTALSKWRLPNLFANSKTDFSKMVYDKPYCRIQPYLIGMMLGYFMHKSYSGTRRPAWIVAVVAWLIAIALGIILVYVPHENIQKDGRHWTKTEKVFYGMFSKPAWSVALAWVVYACHYGFGGLIQKFLSARFWIPLSRLTYSAYLVHPIVLSYMFTGSKTSLYYDNRTIAFSFITAVVLSYACAFILAVVIEFPCDNLENFAVNSVGKKKRAN